MPGSRAFCCDPVLVSMLSKEPARRLEALVLKVEV